MIAVVQVVLSGILFGLGAASSIGPVNIEIIRRGLRFGFAPAFFLGLGAVSVDCFYFALVLRISERLSLWIGEAAFQRPMFAVAAALLIWMGVASIRAARTLRVPAAADAEDSPDDRSANTPPENTPAPRPLHLTAKGAYGVGLAMTLTNPMTIVFWASVAPSIAAGAGASASVDAAGPSPWLALAGVGLGAFAWVCFLTGVLAWLRQWMGDRFLRWVNLTSGALLLAFGLRFAWLAAIPG